MPEQNFRHISFFDFLRNCPVGLLYQIQKILYTMFSIIHYVNLLF